MQGPRPLLEIRDDQAQLLAGWHAVALDLQHVIHATQSLIRLLQQTEPDTTIVRSLWSSALVSYARCFAHGCRVRLEKSMYRHLPGDPIGTHDYYKHTRDKHIAHPVNAFEEVRVGVMTDDEGAVVGVGHLACFRISDAVEGVAQLEALASVAFQHVASVIKPLEDSLLSRAKENPDLVASLRSVRIQQKGGGEAARTARTSNATSN